MTKKIEKIDKHIPAENPEEVPSEKTKRSIKNRLGRLLMITDVKNKTLKPDFKRIKDEMYETFCRTGVWKSDYVNRMFRLYADKEKDIRIFKPQFKLFSKYAISVPDVSETEPIRVTQYIKTLRFIRKGLGPMMHQIKHLASVAKTHASEEIKKENVYENYTGYDRENEKQTEHSIARKHLKESMETQKYDSDRFLQEQTIIADCLKDNNYQDLMIFALLGFHYLDKKNDVYDAFLPKQLDAIKISFTLPGFHPVAISLGTFLKIIEHLDFKKHLFSV